MIRLTSDSQVQGRRTVNSPVLILLSPSRRVLPRALARQVVRDFESGRGAAQDRLSALCAAVRAIQDDD